MTITGSVPPEGILTFVELKFDTHLHVVLKEQLIATGPELNITNCFDVASAPKSNDEISFK